MSMSLEADVLILGAGPAGLCAALRLQQLRYRVVVLDRCALPRPQIGESLTPGVRNILDLLDAHHALAQVPYLGGLPTRVIWRTPDPELVRPQPSGGGVLLDRGVFDLALYRLAAVRGALCLAPAVVRTLSGTPGAWHVQIASGQESSDVTVRLILDARGRSGRSAHHVPCAPRLLALWAEVADGGATQTDATQVEARDDGWLWGAPLPDGRYRLMGVCDPVMLRATAPGQPEQWFRARLRTSRLFAGLADTAWNTPLQACSATPYVDGAAWRTGQLKLGDAALTLDPLSSSGVEKAMRFSLQAVVAVHTLLSDPRDESVARDFFVERLLESAARHTLWTQRSYQQYWRGQDLPFWRARATAFDFSAWSSDPAATALRRVYEHLLTQEQGASSLQATNQPLPQLQDRLMLCPDVKFVELACVVEDRVRSRMAISHPHLERPLAYLEGEEIVPLLRMLEHGPTLATMLEFYGYRMPMRTARRLIGWLWQKGVLRVVT